MDKAKTLTSERNIPSFGDPSSSPPVHSTKRHSSSWHGFFWHVSWTGIVKEFLFYEVPSLPKAFLKKLCTSLFYWWVIYVHNKFFLSALKKMHIRMIIFENWQLKWTIQGARPTVHIYLNFTVIITEMPIVPLVFIPMRTHMHMLPECVVAFTCKPCSDESRLWPGLPFWNDDCKFATRSMGQHV